MSGNLITRPRQSDAGARKPNLADGLRAGLTLGEIIDASPLAREAGFKWPVYITKDAWELAVEWSAQDAADCEVKQDEHTRLWELLTWFAYHKESALSCILEFSYFQIPRGARRRELFSIELKAVAAPGFHGLPCYTIMLPTEH